MQRTANTLGLKVTAESKKKYIKKSGVGDKYRRMVGYVSEAVRRELKTEVSWRVFGMKYS